MITHRIAACIVVAALTACARGDEGARTDTAAVAGDTARAGRQAPAEPAGETTGFDTPESVRYDADLDVYFVSNINGNPSQKDNNGYIARVSPDSLDRFTRLAEGGRNGVTLHAPKGMAIVGDTLWVTDIDVVRGFDKRSGAPVATIELAGQNPTFLNDIAVGIDGIYVTDTNIRFAADGSMSSPGTDRVFRITGRTVSVVARGDSLGRPNGITWDGANTRFIIVPFNSTAIMSWRPGDASPSRLAEGPGQFDGVEVLGDGRVVVTSWADSAVHVLRNGTLSRLAADLPAPADLGVDTKRNLLLVPLFNDGIVRYFRM